MSTGNCILPAGVVLVIASACSSPSDSGSAPRSDLVGDWLPCANADCSEVGDDGYRFLADGTALYLNGEDSTVSGAPICVELEASAGVYHFDGSRLTLEGLDVTAQLDGDQLTLYDVPLQSSDGDAGVAAARFRRLETYEGAPCSSDAPQL